MLGLCINAVSYILYNKYIIRLYTIHTLYMNLSDYSLIVHEMNNSWYSPIVYINICIKN